LMPLRRAPCAREPAAPRNTSNGAVRHACQGVHRRARWPAQRNRGGGMAQPSRGTFAEPATALGDGRCHVKEKKAMDVATSKRKRRWTLPRQREKGDGRCHVE